MLFWLFVIVITSSVVLGNRTTTATTTTTATAIMTADPEEVIEAMADPETGHVQVPFNVLDWRWREAGIAEVCAKRPDVTVHARSCFLQGILCCTSEDRWPARFGRDLAKEYVAKLGMLAKKLGRKNQADLCLAYVNNR